MVQPTSIEAGARSELLCLSRRLKKFEFRFVVVSFLYCKIQISENLL